MVEEGYDSTFLDSELVYDNIEEKEIQALKATIKKFQEESIIVCEKYTNEIAKTKILVDQVKKEMENELNAQKSESQRMKEQYDLKLKEIDFLIKDLESKKDEIKKKNEIIEDSNGKILTLKNTLFEKERELNSKSSNYQNKIQLRDQVCVNLGSKVEFNQKKVKLFETLNKDQKLKLDSVQNEFKSIQAQYDSLQNELETTKKVLSQTVIEATNDRARLLADKEILGEQLKDSQEKLNALQYISKELELKSQEKITIQCSEKDELQAQLSQYEILYMDSQQIILQQNEKISKLTQENAKNEISLQEKSFELDSLKLIYNTATSELLLLNSLKRELEANLNNFKLDKARQKDFYKKFLESLRKELREVLPDLDQDKKIPINKINKIINTINNQSEK